MPSHPHYYPWTCRNMCSLGLTALAFIDQLPEGHSLQDIQDLEGGFHEWGAQIVNLINTYLGAERSCYSISIKLALRCSCCCLALNIHGHGFSSYPVKALIQDRLQDFSIRSALYYPLAGIKVQEVLPDAGSTSYKNKLAVPVLVRHVFQLNDLDMNPLLPHFLGTWPGTEIYTYNVHVRMHWGGNR